MTPTTTSTTIDAAKIALRLHKEENELEASSLKSLEEQAKITQDISKLATKLNIDYDSIHKTFGKNVEKLTIQEKLQQKQKTHTTYVNVIEKELNSKLKEKVEWNNKLNKFSDMDKTSREKAGKQLRQDLSVLIAKHAEQMNGLKEVEKQLKSHNEKLEFKNNLLKVGDTLTGGILSRIKEYANPMNLILDLINTGVNNFLSLDKAGTQLRKDLGLIRGEADGFQKNIKNITLETYNLGVHFEDVQKSITAISDKFTFFTSTNKELVRDVTIFGKVLGIAADDSSEFLKSLGGITRSTADANKNMLGFAKEVSTASHVPLGRIMKDVSEAAKNSSAYIKTSVVSLISGAAQAKMMGTTLEKMAQTSRKLIDFQTSINDEMEASVMLGKNISFQRARQFAWEKDTISANKEILRIAQQLDFSRMDPLQMESFAKASGKTVGEIQDMLQADKEISYIKQSGNVELNAQLDKLEEMKKYRKEEAEDLGKQAIKRIQMESNQERMNALQDKFNQLMMQLSEPVMTIAEPLLKIATTILPAIFKVIVPIFGMFKKLAPAVADIAGMFGTIGKFAAPFIRLLGPIGLIINAFTLIGSIMKRWENSPKTFKDGIVAVFGGLYDTLIGPFEKAYKWIASFWVGNSPSELGLGILKGIVSIGGMLLDAITAPFRTGFNFISGLFGFGKIPAPSTILSQGVQSNGGTLNSSTSESKSTVSSAQTPVDNTNQLIVKKLDELIGLMKNGAIAVNIDGNRASYLLYKNTMDRGGLGSIS